MPLIKTASVSAMFFIVMQAAFAGECSVKSIKQPVPLLELYTSEGCSSCPPADKWLSGLDSNGYSAANVVPLAFHVDYWDYIGWKDRFAKTAYSDRQRDVNAWGGASFVYTPQITLNGKDYRGWSQPSRFNDALAAAQNKPARASLAINMMTAATKTNVTVRANTASADDAKHADAYIAVYENNLASKVNAGENSGRQLRHDYVVRELYGPYHLNKLPAGQSWQQELALGPEWKNRDVGVAAFVQNNTNGEVLQSIKLGVCFN